MSTNNGTESNCDVVLCTTFKGIILIDCTTTVVGRDLETTNFLSWVNTVITPLYNRLPITAGDILAEKLNVAVGKVMILTGIKTPPPGTTFPGLVSTLPGMAVKDTLRCH
jgi:hypothetical protein